MRLAVVMYGMREEIRIDRLLRKDSVLKVAGLVRIYVYLSIAKLHLLSQLPTLRSNAAR